MSLAEKMSEGLIVLGVGLMVVFGILILLWGLLELMRVVFYHPDNKPSKQEKQEAVKSAPAAQVVPIAHEDDEEIIAVIAAAIAASLNTSVHNLRIKSVRRISNWNK